MISSTQTTHITKVCWSVFGRLFIKATESDGKPNFVALLTAELDRTRGLPESVKKICEEIMT